MQLNYSNGMRQLGHGDDRRKGAAVVELALLSLLLMALFVFAIDYCRVFWFAQILDECARAGALYAYDPANQAASPYANVETAVKASAPAFLRDSLTVTTGSANGFLTVQVAYNFSTITRYPFIPQNVTLRRTTVTRIAPVTPL